MILAPDVEHSIHPASFVISQHAYTIKREGQTGSGALTVILHQNVLAISALEGPMDHALVGSWVVLAVLLLAIIWVLARIERTIEKSAETNRDYLRNILAVLQENGQRILMLQRDGLGRVHCDLENIFISLKDSQK